MLTNFFIAWASAVGLETQQRHARIVILYFYLRFKILLSILDAVIVLNFLGFGCCVETQQRLTDNFMLNNGCIEDRTIWLKKYKRATQQ